MSRSLIFQFSIILSAVLFNPSLLIGQDEIPADQLAFFEKKIRPVLVAHCYQCHSQDSKALKGGLALDTMEGIRAGGDTGHAVVPGDVEGSVLMEAIRYESMEMPPKQQLSQSVIGDFQKWIEMGAPDPRKGASLIKREIDFHDAKQHWSFQPIVGVQPPAVEDESWPKSSVDQFVLAQLESKGLKPVGDASRQVLVRRLFYDLIGLPPSSAQLQIALGDDNPDAIENLVDRLLDSPQFGERWGRHWLDVVRYAESNGRERNVIYPTAWRYRDYVIDAFNNDTPFNRFIQEQLAGDLLPGAGDNEAIATGFLAIGPKLLNEGNREAFVMDLVDDQIDVTTRAFMGLTVSCARCHDHKFDPIPTAEYYSMAGIFRSTSTLYGTNKQQGNRQGSSLVALSIPESGKSAVAKQRKQRESLTRELRLVQKSIVKFQAETKEIANRKKKDKKYKPDAKQAAAVKKSLSNARKKTSSLQKKIKSLSENDTEFMAMGVREGKVADSPIYVRGEVKGRKGTAARGFLTILESDLEQQVIENGQSGRKELADWIIAPENPMTARVAVNRVWHHLFGNGIVRTVDNFGATGETPTHPELLDFLADGFKEQGWSMKRLIRELVLSRTYQLAADYSQMNYEVDPDNFSLWRHEPQRVDAEALRDAMLLASGDLNLSPAFGSPISKLRGEFGRGNSAAVVREASQHRSVYLPIVRNAVPDVLKLFDFAEPSILVGERPITTVPTQALYFLNSEIVTSQCDRLAERLLADESIDDKKRVNLAYQSVLSRNATGPEIERARKYIDNLANEFSDSAGDAEKRQRIAWSGFCQVLFGSAEFRYVD
ncbi:PSD1 and planctomycete cytochrome C domain-containing protein [Mariniblastus sp.]|nr:PSD1 and planctomycete cytochrome C domain-containing protein [Mariniblastus sp.]